ncbi:MAG: hypothetical protein IT449_18685 [Phycisphaerales bacterium]|nr:hypothetical protein [Phycisphaerales bacterium]
MLALTSVWLGVLCLLLSGLMLMYPPAMTQGSLILVLEFLAPGSLCLAGLVLWAHRKDENPEAAVVAQRLQAKTAIVLTLLACAIVYVIFLVLANKE